MVELANTIWRDSVIEGVPSSGANKPSKADIREWGTYIEQLYAAAQAGGGVVFQTRAAMNSNLSYPANQIAWVVSDATAANNGIYQKQGESGTGSWLRLGDLPYSFIRASNAGTGTANAIIATTPIPIPAADAGALITLPIVSTTTSTFVTVSFNGGSPLEIKTNTGNALTVGALVSGMIVVGFKDGATFRLLSDQASEAILAAAEAAAAAAEAAAAGVNMPSVTPSDAGKTLVVNASGTGYVVSDIPREKLTSDRTYYVRADGNDSNSGLVNSTTGAFKTLQRAADVIYGNLDLNGFDVLVQATIGPFTSGAILTGVPVGATSASSIVFRGDLTTPGNITVSTTGSDCFLAQYGAKFTVEGFRLSTSSSGKCLNAYGAGEINYRLIEFDTCAGPHKEVSLGGRITNTGDYSIVGSAQSHDHCTIGGQILNINATVTLVGTPNFSAYYCGANGACAVQYSGITFVGSATGQRFVAHQLGSIYTGGQGWNYLPGNLPGGCYGGGSYDDSSQRFNNGAFPSQPVASGGTVAAAFADANLSANVFGVFNYTNDANAPICYSSKSRSGAVGSHGIVQNGDLVQERRASASNGTSFVNGFIERVAVEGTPTTDATAMPMGYRLLLSPDVSTPPVERYRIDRLGNPYFPTIGTTASAANAFLNSASSPVANQLQRSTSSARYKRDIEDLDITYAKKLLDARPVYYRSAVETDDQGHSHWGLIAEELAEIDPRLVHFGYRNEDWEQVEVEVEETDTEGNVRKHTFIEPRLRDGAEKVPDGVQYERLVVHLLALVKDLYVQIDDIRSERATRKG